ncbi:54S ribosomal protein L4 mitochondrial, partial [Cladochytrium tenue]
RAWTAEELRTKSFDDLHKLWWICIKEKNKLLSQQDEAVRFAVIFFHKPRMRQVKRTMRNIKLVLWERRIAYMQAQAIVERETTRMALLRQYQEEEDGKENAQDEPAADPAALERRAEAELRRRFPVPVHEIGRQAAAKRRVQEARRKAKRPRHKGTRWFVV